MAAARVSAVKAEATAQERVEQELGKTAEALGRANAQQAAAQLAHFTTANRAAVVPHNRPTW